MYSINVQAKHGQSIFKEENFIKSLEVEQVYKDQPLIPKFP